MDDTSARINSLTHEFKLAANGGVEKIKGARTGVHTTGFIAKLPEGKVCFFETGLHHAGEVFEKIMKSNSIEDEVILMVDAASANLSKLKYLSLNAIAANCNSHARRKFDEQADDPVYKENIDPMSVNDCSKEPFGSEKTGWAPPPLFQKSCGRCRRRYSHDHSHDCKRKRT